MKLQKFMLLLAAALLLMSGLPAAAQDRMVLTVTTPPWMNWVLEDENLVRRFEEAFPGATFVYVPPTEETMNLNSIVYEEEPADYFDKMETYVSMADVTFVSRWFFGPEATAAGYFLNLAPLAETDPTLDLSDYYTAVWESYQWDRGLWAIPTSGQVTFMMYDANAFDQAGIAYPNDNWTLTDFANAVGRLTQRDGEGNLILPGWQNSIQTSTLFRSLLGQGFYDGSQLPSPPQLNSPELVTMLEQWQAMEEEGLLNLYEFTGDWQQIPLRFEGMYFLDQGNMSNFTSGQRFVPVMMPNDSAQIYSDGFAVSSGTQNPELAYRLARFLAEETGWQFGGEPARRSQTTGNENMYQPQLSAEHQAFMEYARENALPISEVRYADYVDLALQKMAEDDLDPQAALEAVQAEAMENFQMALDRAASVRIVVAPPPPPVELAAGEVALTFGLDLYSPVVPNRDQWDQMVSEFVASEPGIGHVELDTTFWGPDGVEADCYFQPYNQLQNAELDLTQFYNMDPFMDADPNFAPDDFIGVTLDMAQRNNQTWGYPITIQPNVMMYEKEAFRTAGVPFPESGWTVDEFIRTLETLNASLGEERSAFMVGGGNTELLMLVAAFGGLPVDYRTEPPAFNFTDPANVTALQQVLDLIRSGIIDYGAMTPYGYQLMEQDSGRDYRPPVMFVTQLSPYNFGSGPQGEENPYSFVTFPRGSQYQGAIVDVGMAYISSNSQNPEACYRWISKIAQQPGLFPGMPARRSQLTDAGVATVQGEDVSAVYQSVAQLLDDPGTIPFRYGGSGPASWAEQTWLNKVIDLYVLGEQSMDLASELAEAQDYTLAFRECAASLPPFDPEMYENPGEAEAYFKQFDDCANRADPEWINQFSQS